MFYAIDFYFGSTHDVVRRGYHIQDFLAIIYCLYCSIDLEEDFRRLAIIITSTYYKQCQLVINLCREGEGEFNFLAL